MNTQTNWLAYFRAVEAAREKREAKFGRLPLWWYPMAAFTGIILIFGSAVFMTDVIHTIILFSR